MRLLFAYDHRFRRTTDGKVLTTGAFSSSIWQRYLKVFEEVIVTGRDDGIVDDSAGSARSDIDGVSFAFLEDVHSPARMFRRPAVMREISKLVAQSDAVVARLPSHFGLLACDVARKLNKPYLIEVVGSAFDGYANHGSLAGRLLAPLFERSVRNAVAKAPLVIYVTERWLQSQYPSKHPEFVGDQFSPRSQFQASATDALLHIPGSERVAASITNAAVVLPMSEVHENRQRRLTSLAAGRPPVLGTIGSLATRYKGIQVALPALAELRSEGLRFEYRILGGGDPTPWQKLIDEHGLGDCCHLDGVLPAGPRVLEWLDGIDIYLQPSLTEALPRAVLEAMSRGLPCIGSSVGGIPELIRPDFVHEPGDSRGLASDLRRLMTDPGEVARLSEFSFERVVNYAPEIVEGKREAMLRALRVRAEHQGGAAFVHDHVFTYSREGKVWTSGAHSSGLWERYLNYFRHLSVVGRDGGFTADLSTFARSDHPNVSFRLLPSINGVREMARRPHVREQIRNVVLSSDAVIARLPSEFGFVACKFAHRYRKPLLVEVVGAAGKALHSHGSWVARCYAPLADWRTRRAVANSPFVAYVTRSWLQQLYPSPNPPLGVSSDRAQAVVPDVILSLPTPEVREKRDRRLRELEEGRVPVFGTVASLAVRYKGLQTSIPAFARLKAEGHRFTYLILGPGDPNPWQKLIDECGLDDCCFLQGPRPAGDDVLKWLDGIDVHVQPSLTESLGRAQIEAMSRGVACISSNAGGLSEYGDADWLHPPEDVGALTELLRRLVASPQLVRSRSDAAFNTVERFDPVLIERERSALMERLAAASRRA